MNYVIIEWEGHPHCAAIHVHTCCMGCWNIHCTVVKSLKQSYFVYTLDSSGGSRDFHKGGQLTAEEVVGFSDSLNYYFCYLKRGRGLAGKPSKSFSVFRMRNGMVCTLMWDPTRNYTNLICTALAQSIKEQLL